MIQKDALHSDFDKTAYRYAQFHEQWEKLLYSKKLDLLKISSDLIIANIPYLIHSSTSLRITHREGVTTLQFARLQAGVKPAHPLFRAPVRERI